MTRDIVFLVLLSVSLIVVLVLFLKVLSVLKSAKRTIGAAEEIITTVSENVVGPAAAGSGVAFGAGKAMAFLFGLKKRRKGAKDDG